MKWADWDIFNTSVWEDVTLHCYGIIAECVLDKVSAINTGFPQIQPIITALRAQIYEESQK